MNNTGKQHLITAKKRLNSAQLEIQRALSLENDDGVLMFQMEELLDGIHNECDILDFVMGAYGMEIVDATE